MKKEALPSQALSLGGDTFCIAASSGFIRRTGLEFLFETSVLNAGVKIFKIF